MLKPSFHKRYELSNHASTSLSTGASISLSTCLGNVLAVVSDRKLPECIGDSFLYNKADITNATDYSPFGAPLPGRVYNTPTNITSDTTAWIKGWEPSTVSTSYVGNRLKVDVSTLWAGIRRSIKTVPGHNYVFKTTVDLHTAGSVYIFARRMSPNNTSGNIKVIHTSVSGTYEVHFTALDTLTYLHVEEGGSYTSGTVTFYLENTIVQDKQLGGKGYRFGYQGSEKSDEIDGSGNYYTTYFREVDTRLGRWLSIDPKLTAWESPYVSMGNNPIFNNDILGDKIGKGKEHFDNLNKNVDAKMNNALKETRGLEKKLKGLDENSTKAIGLKKELNSWNSTLAELSDIKCELNEMEMDQNTTFNFNVIETNGLSNGNFSYDNETKEFNINFTEDGYIGNMAHEAKHGYQLLTGKLSYTTGGAPGVLYDAVDEVEAYKRQFFIDPGGKTASSWYSQFKSLNVDVKNVKEFSNGHYKSLPSVQLSKSSTLMEINEARKFPHFSSNLDRTFENHQKTLKQNDIQKNIFR